MILSGRMYTMLRMFDGGVQVSAKRMGQFDQRTVRSMLYHEWISYNESHGFYRTRSGTDAVRDFEQANITRKVASLQLTSYFYRVFASRRAAAA